ncbi:MAG: hypothetical protein K2Z81_13820, partial [Cyanobacteria bacterium]|nr:hypothetical protein [Cyanobacteriota bacterium]
MIALAGGLATSLILFSDRLVNASGQSGWFGPSAAGYGHMRGQRYSDARKRFDEAIASAREEHVSRPIVANLLLCRAHATLMNMQTTGVAQDLTEASRIIKDEGL